jgi:hypothetical protein
LSYIRAQVTPKQVLKRDEKGLKICLHLPYPEQGIDTGNVFSPPVGAEYKGI